MKQWLCIICGFVYDEALGLPNEGIPPGTAWADVPDDWKCPECGVGKSDFEMVELYAPAESAAVPAPAAAAVCAEGVVIVGAGHAGFAAAEAVRKRYPAQSIVLVTDDAGDRYSKPKLSVCVSMSIPPAALVQEPADSVASRLAIEVRSGVRVNHVNVVSRVLETTAGRIPYGKLILATGADPIRLPWFDDSVLSVNRLADLTQLASQLQRPRRIVIIGSGLIGCELANDLTRAGHKVTVLSNAPYPLDRLVPQPVGEALQAALAGVGVEWRLRAAVQSGRRAGGVSLIELADGRAFEADVVISAIGLRPALGLARAAGLACEQGIVVDHACRSSDSHVFALGDVAQYPDGLKQFIPPINHGAQVLAEALLDDAAAAARRKAADLPLMPIIAKTPDCPIAVVLPRFGSTAWQIGVEGRTTVARCFDGEGRLSGFALAGPAANDLKPWLAQIWA